jgi:acyl carrier protein
MNTKKNAVKEELVNFLFENFIAGRSISEKESVLSDDDSLIDSGIIDSTGILEVVMFIEEKYLIKVEDDELVPENLDSINNLLSFLKRKGVEAA